MTGQGGEVQFVGGEPRSAAVLHKARFGAGWIALPAFSPTKPGLRCFRNKVLGKFAKLLLPYNSGLPCISYNKQSGQLK